MTSGLADFIEQHTDAILEHAITFARTVEVHTPLDDEALRDHLPGIIEAIVADLRRPQTRAEEIEKSEGRAVAVVGQPRSAAGTHALHRAHSGYSVSQLVSEYRALRASVLRLWAEAPGRTSPSPEEVTRFNEAIDEAIAESVTHYATEVERWRNIFLGVLGHDLRSPLSAILLTSELLGRMAVDAPIASAAQRLIRSGQRMRELLDKLLVYNRAQMGVGFDIQRTDVDLAQACREEIDLLQAAMPATRIHFQSPASLHGSFDAERLREALANLVVNAVKYGTPGSEIHVELRDADGSAELAVRNHGDPIPRETLDPHGSNRYAAAAGAAANRNAPASASACSSLTRSRRPTAVPSARNRRTVRRRSGCACRAAEPAGVRDEVALDDQDFLRAFRRFM